MALVKYNNNSISAITSAAAISSGAMTLIKEQTASSSATISFLDGTSDVVLDSTYPIYVFKFINIHPATDDTRLTFQSDTGTNTNYNQTITSSCFQAKHSEADDDNGLAYQAGNDQAQGTAFQRITDSIGNANDASAVGSLYIFNPSSSTYVKHFMCRTQHMVGSSGVGSKDLYYAGYFNTTTALTRFQFKMASGNIDAGTIKLYGIKDS